MTDLNDTPETTNLDTDENVQTSVLGTETPQTIEENPSETQTQNLHVPESIDGYQVEVEGFNFEDFKSFEENQAFLERARGAGFGNKELNFLLGEYNQLLPSIVNANASLDAEACTNQMQEMWGNDTGANFGFAHTAAQNAIQNGILTAEEINSPEFGNNPLVLKMAAYFGKQLQEDAPPSNTQQSGTQSIEELMLSEAYSDANHPDHKSVAKQVSDHFKKNFPG